MKAILLFALFASAAHGAEPRRGVLEGFYGTPWSWASRRSMVRWMGENGFDLFVLAPKDEPLHRARWRDPLTREYFEGLSLLVTEAKAAGVSLAWGILPRGAAWDKEIEVRAAVDKIAGVAAHGVEEILLCFDDIAPERGHFLFANRVREELAARGGPQPRLTFVPAVYWGDGAGGSYWRELKRELHPSFRVAWTGQQILSRRIAASDAEAFAETAGREIVMGDNYPVQDRLSDAGRLFLGPVYGREAGAVAPHAAWVANATPLAEASKPALYTVAQFLRDPPVYEPCAAMRRGAHALGGRRAARHLAVFLRENSASWLDGGLDPDCGPGLAAVLRAYSPGRDASEALNRLGEMQRLPALLQRELRFFPALRRELKPWIDKLGDEAAAAAAALEMAEGGFGGARRELLERRYRSAKKRADDNRAVVSNLEITRFLNRLEAYRRGEKPRFAETLNERLRGAVEGSVAPTLLAASLAEYEELPHHELVPLLDILEAEAAHARARMNGAAGEAEFFRRLKTRVRFVPLLAAKKIMDDHFARIEARWVDAPRRAGVPMFLKLWLLWRSWTQPQSLTARLWDAAETYRKTGDAAGLKPIFNELASLPQALRESHRGRIPEEVYPWLDRVGDYGVLGLRSIRLAALYDQGIEAHKDERRDWRRLRSRLASGNGLEMALETKQHLAAFGRWSLLPAGKRPQGLDLTLPANPADLL